MIKVFNFRPPTFVLYQGNFDPWRFFLGDPGRDIWNKVMKKLLTPDHQLKFWCAGLKYPVLRCPCMGKLCTKFPRYSGSLEIVPDCYAAHEEWTMLGMACSEALASHPMTGITAPTLSRLNLGTILQKQSLEWLGIKIYPKKRKTEKENLCG